jgi:hypothetical protein
MPRKTRYCGLLQEKALTRLNRGSLAQIVVRIPCVTLSSGGGLTTSTRQMPVETVVSA